MESKLVSPAVLRHSLPGLGALGVLEPCRRVSWGVSTGLGSLPVEDKAPACDRQLGGRSRPSPTRPDLCVGRW